MWGSERYRHGRPFSSLSERFELFISMLKERILKLHKEGKSYNEIVQLLNCSKATVSYHCSDKSKQQYKTYRNINRKKSIKDLKALHGSQCSICGYNKCLSSLHFHHLDPSIKDGGVAELIYSKGKKAAIDEAKKCKLICANCHGEIHEGLIKI